MIKPLRPVLIAVICVISVLSVGQARAQGFIRDAEIERTLRLMSDPILEAAGLNPSSVNFYIINDKSMNAFVAGGRNIFVHTGLLMKLESPEEIQGVIAHETGHIVGGHLARRAIKIRNAQGPAIIGALAGIAIAAAGGGAAGAVISAGSQGAILRDLLSHSRAEEASADQAAMTFLKRSKIDPTGLQKVFERFRGQEVFTVGNVDPYAVTHPLSAERIQLINRRVSEIDPADYQPDEEVVYWHGRMRAKLEGFLDNPERVLRNLEGEPETETTLYAKAIALHRAPSPKEAVQTADQLIALRPNDPYYNELKGQILFESGDAEAAVPIYRRASALAPKSSLLKAALGRALLALNDPASDKEALKILQEARRNDMADATALRDLATAYSRAGDYGMATLATAERHALTGRREDAVFQARRAAGLLPEGSPGWLRAQDILSLRVEK